VLLAQLLAQFFPFLGGQLPFRFAWLNELARGLQRVTQLGPALFTLAWTVVWHRSGGGLGDRLRQGMPREAKEENQSAKSLHDQI
jgi:hypothetical protein